MLTTIYVYLDKVYGKKTIRPACDLSSQFAELVSQKTLTDRDVRIIQKMGFEVTVIPPATSL